MYGRASHFNLDTPLDAFLWSAMILAIVVTTLTMVGVAVAALGPLPGATELSSWAWRAALWLFLLAAVSGFGMGGSGPLIPTHTPDGIELWLKMRFKDSPASGKRCEPILGMVSSPATP